MPIYDQRADDILTETVRRVRSIKGGPGIRVVNASTGITISLDRGAISIPAPNVVPIPGAIVAYLTQIGGSNGSTTSYCTYTYNAYFDAAKTQLAGGTLTVQAHRMLKVAVTAATLGLIQLDSSNTYSLMAVLDEYYGQNACT